MKQILTLLLWFILPLCSFVWVVFWGSVDTNDWLGQSYNDSHQNPKWWYPYSSDVEADDLFNTNMSISTSSWVWLSDSVLVRAARFLMRIAVMLGIPILIYGWIRIALAFGDTGKMKEAVKQIGYLVWWLLLVLFSVLLIVLLTSLTRSSLDLFQSDLW